MKSYIAALFATFLAASSSFAATSITQHHITWTFDKDYPVGKFVNGDWYVVGPAKIVSITNDLNDKSFLPEDGTAVNGSMINPTITPGKKFGDTRQGYDERIRDYVPEFNAAMPNDKPLSADNPLVLKPDQSLISVVSFLWRGDGMEESDREEGCRKPQPKAIGGVPTPTLRAAAVLTCLDKAPPEGTFRPAYAGDEKRLFNVKQLRLDRLGKLDPVGPVTFEPTGASYPNINYHSASIPQLIETTTPVWLDHIPSWWGWFVFNPLLNLPNYGREKAHILIHSMLALNLDWDKIEGAPAQPDKMPLLINIVQIGIDLAGIADAGGEWTEDGGHGHARKPAILFAGLLLDDAHMKSVGQWKTPFQENNQTFYVSESDVEICESEGWKADAENRRAKGQLVAPYTKDMIGMPEWNFSRVRIGPGCNAAWQIAYRSINNSAIGGFSLVFNMMEDGKKLFNHDAYFDYADRVQSRDQELTSKDQSNRMPAFPMAMWREYRDKYPSTYDAKKWDDEAILDAIHPEKE